MEMVEQSGMSQSQVSQTLQKLRMSGIVESERQGSSIYYHIRCEQLQALLKRIEEIYPAI
jgi:DNA-binding transcriptional ArsR family regulator